MYLKLENKITGVLKCKVLVMPLSHEFSQNVWQRYTSSKFGMWMVEVTWCPLFSFPYVLRHNLLIHSLTEFTYRSTKRNKHNVNCMKLNLRNAGDCCRCRLSQKKSHSHVNSGAWAGECGDINWLELYLQVAAIWSYKVRLKGRR